MSLFKIEFRDKIHLFIESHARVHMYKGWSVYFEYVDDKKIPAITHVFE